MDLTEQDIRIARNVAVSIVGRRNYEDAYQEALIGVWQAKKEGLTDISHLVVRARREVIDAYRRESGRLKTSSKRMLKDNTYSYDAENRGRGRPLIDSLPDPVDAMGDAETTFLIDDMVEATPERDKPRVRHILEGLRDGANKLEMAQRLGISDGRVSQLLRPAKALYA